MQYVYKIQAGNFIKIGIANDVRRRILQLQTGNPYRLELLSCYGFDDASAVERVLHQAFSKSRGVGEFFELTTSQSNDFETICQMLGGERANFDGNISADEIENAENSAERMIKLEKYYAKNKITFDENGIPHGPSIDDLVADIATDKVAILRKAADGYAEPTESETK